MKKLLLSTLAMLSFGLYTTHAQLNITITQADFAQASSTTTMVMLVDTTPTINVGSAGTGQTWDFTSLAPMLLDSNVFSPPSNTGLDVEFTNANQKWEASQLTTYLNNTSASIEIEGILAQQMELMGFPIDLGAETAFPFDNPMTFIELPAIYNDTYTDTSTFMYTTDGSFIPQVNIDSVRLKHTSVLESTMDADGTLTNPGDTVYDVLRQYRVERRIDTVEVYVTDAITALFLGVPMNQWSYFQYQGFDNPVLDTMYTYSWYAKDQDFPVASVEVDINDAPIRATWIYVNNLMALVDATVNSACPAAANGEAFVNVIGGTAPFSYTWDNGETTLDASMLTSGQHTMTVSDNISATFILSVTVEADPDYNISLGTTAMTCDTCNDGSVVISGAGGTGPYTYNWSNGATTSSISGLSGGSNYSITVTDTYGCQAEASTYISGIDITELLDVNLYPNPVKNGLLYVNTSAPVQIEIYNLLGEQLYSTKIVTSQTVQMSDYVPGVYMVKVKTDKGTVTKKILVE